MMSKETHRVVIGVFRSREAAENCFQALLNRGYLSSDVNVLMTERTRRHHYTTERTAVESIAKDLTGRTSFSQSTSLNSGSAAGSKAVQGVGVGGSIGTAIGATLAAMAAVGTSLIIPGLNLIVAGPLVAVMAGGGAGALAGGLVGGLVGLGIPEQDAVVYNRALQEGGVVMSVHGRPEDANEIKGLMIQNSGEQVCCSNC